MSDASTTDAPAPPPRRVGRRVLLAVIALLAIVGACAIAFAMSTAAHLERVVAWSRVRRELDARHMTLSLGSGRLGTSGLELHDLTLRITKARKNAPVTTIVVPHLRVDASLWSLAFSSSKRVEHVLVEGLAVEAMRYARDEDDPEKGKGDDGEDEDDTSEPLELAKTLVGLGQLGVELGGLAVGPVTVVTERRSLTTGNVVRFTIRGLEGEASFAKGELAFAMGSPKEPRLVAVERAGAKATLEKAAFNIATALRVAPGGTVDSSLVVDLLDQDFEPRAPRKTRLLSASVHATSDAVSQEVRVAPASFDALGGLVTGELEAVHRDTPKGSIVTLRAATMKVQSARIPELLASSVSSRLDVHDGEPLVFQAKALTFGPDVIMGSDASVALAGSVRELRVRLGDDALVLQGLRSTGHIGFAAGGVPSGNLELALDRFEAPGGVVVAGASIAATAALAPPATSSRPTKAIKGASATSPRGVDLSVRARVTQAKTRDMTLRGATFDARGALDGRVLRAPTAHLAVDEVAASGTKATGLVVDVQGPALVDSSAPPPFDVSTRADVALAALTTDGVRVDNVAMTFALDGTTAAARPTLDGTAKSVRIAAAVGKQAESPIAFTLATEAPMDLLAAKVESPRVRGKVEGFHGAAVLRATPQGPRAMVTTSVELRDLTAIAPFVPKAGPTLCAPSLARASVAIDASGVLSATELPAGRLRMTGLELCGAPIAVKAGEFDASWGAVRLGGALDARVSLARLALGDEAATRALSVVLHGRRAGVSSGELRVDAQGERMPTMHLAANVAYAPKDKSLAFAVDSVVEHLDVLPLSLRSAGPHGLDALERVRLNSQGIIKGLLDRWDASGVVLAPQAFTGSSGALTLEGALSRVRMHGDKGAKLAVESATIDASFTKSARQIDLRAELAVDGFDADTAQGGAKLNGLRASVAVASPDLDKVDARANLLIADATLRGKQRVSLGKVTFGADARGSVNEAVTITRLELASAGTGTSFSATGSVDLRPRTAPVGVGDIVVVGRESAFLRGTLVQELAPLAQSIPGLGARGRIRAPLVVAAGDRSLVRIDGTVELAGVAVDWIGGSVEGLEGRVPVMEDLRIEGDSLRLVPSTTNAFTRERFEDQQPLVAETSFVRVKRLVIGERAFGPLGASVRVDRNTLAVDRLELRALNGAVGGRLFVDVRGADTRIDFRGDVTGLELADDKKPLDAHLAIRLQPWRRALDGRVDIARTSPDQLRLLLDLYDPYQENVSANRARQALALGYPKAVRMRFQEGFASLGIELGGLSAAVRIDETRGVPIAPMLDKSLLPMLPKEPPRL